MNLPNRLSMYRILLSLILIIVPYIPGVDKIVWNMPLSNIIMAIIFLIASITDILDGEIARKKKLITDFGKFLDPLADKILVLTALVLLVHLEKVPVWIPVIVLTREFAVSGYRLVASTKSGEVIAASIWGKIKTITQMIAISFVFLDNYPIFSFISGKLNLYEAIFNGIGSILLIISVIATVFSGWDYLKNMKEFIKEPKDK